MPGNILIVDDDEFLRRTLTLHLEQAGYRVSTAGSTEEALHQLDHRRPDLILLDIGLPGMDGFDALRRFQQDFKTPVIFLTARRRNMDQILGLQLGADDYITKPFDIDVLLARIHVVLRRAQHPTSAPQPRSDIQIGGLHIDPAAHTVQLNQGFVHLTPIEFDLLYRLASTPGQVVPMSDLLSQVWGPEYLGQPQVVYVHLRSLRQKIEINPARPQRIVSVRGIGYKLAPEGW